MILIFVENPLVNQPLIEGWCGSLVRSWVERPNLCVRDPVAVLVA